jgi:hypothetical protein
MKSQDNSLNINIISMDASVIQTLICYCSVLYVFRKRMSEISSCLYQTAATPDDSAAGSGEQPGRGGMSGSNMPRGTSGSSAGGDGDDEAPDDIRSQAGKNVGSGTDPVASGDIIPGTYNIVGGTTSGGLQTDATATGGAGVGSGAGDVSSIAGTGRSGALGSGTDDLRTTAQPGDQGSPMQANPGKMEGNTGGGAGAAYPDRDPRELNAEPGQARNILPTGEVIPDPDEDDDMR